MTVESRVENLIRTAQLSDLDELLAYENEKLQIQISDEIERSMASWHARWRKESLEHYLKSGWSFVLRNPTQSSSFSKEGRLLGYFLAQPFLFVEGMTQTLWVEYISYSTASDRDELIQLAYRLSREKHFQKVIFPKESDLKNSNLNFPTEPWATEALSVKTSKI